MVDTFILQLLSWLEDGKHSANRPGPVNVLEEPNPNGLTAEELKTISRMNNRFKYDTVSTFELSLTRLKSDGLVINSNGKFKLTTRGKQYVQGLPHLFVLTNLYRHNTPPGEGQTSASFRSGIAGLAQRI